jgi:fumarate reductase subunit D
MQTSNSRQGTLGVLWLIYGILCVARAVWILTNSATFTLMWGALVNRVANPYFWMNLFHVAMLAAVVLTVITAIFSFLAGIGLMQGGRSGRMLALVASFLGLISGPLGIALGVYTLLVMLPQPATQARSDFASAA